MTDPKPLLTEERWCACGHADRCHQGQYGAGCCDGLVETGPYSFGGCDCRGFREMDKS